MSFAQRFQAGMNIGKSLVDTYEQAQYQRGVKDIMAAKAEDGQSYDPDEFAQVQAAQDSGQYDVTYDEGKRGYNIAAKADPSASGFVGIKRGKTFLGKDYRGDLSQEQMDMGRMGAIAELEMARDPARGLQMRREIANQERENKRFGWEEKAAPLKQRGAELAVSTGERSERDGARTDSARDIFTSAIKEYDGSPEQIGPTAQYISATSPTITMGMPDKDGFVQLSIAHKDKPSTFLNLNKAQQAQLYGAGKMMEVDPAAALNIIAGVNKDLAVSIANENGLTGKLADNANSVANKRGGLAIQQQNANTNAFSAQSADNYRKQMGAAAGVRAGGAGGKGAGPVWDKAVEIAKEGHYGGDPEKAYEGLKRGQVRNAMMDDARKLELKLREQALPDDQVSAQVSSFLEGQGVPAPGRIARLRSGVGSDGKPLTPDDYANWDATFPTMKVEDVMPAGFKPPPAAAAPAKKKSGLPDRDIPDRGDPVRAAYDDWQKLKGPWYRPIPKADQRRVDEAEAAYSEMLRNQYSK